MQAEDNGTARYTPVLDEQLLDYIPYLIVIAKIHLMANRLQRIFDENHNGSCDAISYDNKLVRNGMEFNDYFAGANATYMPLTRDEFKQKCLVKVLALLPPGTVGLDNWILKGCEVMFNKIASQSCPTSIKKLYKKDEEIHILEVLGDFTSERPDQMANLSANCGNSTSKTME